MSEALVFHTILDTQVRPRSFDDPVQHAKGIAHCHEVLNGLETAEDPVEHLNDLERMYWQPVATALGGAPLTTLQRYGERALAWTDLRYAHFEHPEFQAAMAQTSYNVKRFERAAAWGRQRRSYSLTFAERQYELASNLEFSIESLPLDEIITDNLRPDSRCKPRQLGSYSLRALEQDHLGSGFLHKDSRPFSNDIYLDAPLGFAICYKDIPQVVGSVSLSYPTELMAYQLQRLRVNHPQSGRGWPRLNWQAALIDVAERLTIDAGLAFTGVQSAQNNSWVRTGLVKERTPKHFRKFYDIPAKQQGYWKGKDNNWHIQHVPSVESVIS